MDQGKKVTYMYVDNTGSRKEIDKEEIVFPDGLVCVQRNTKIWPIAGSFISCTDVAYITYLSIF